MTTTILTLNAGSSSLKFALYRQIADAPALVCRGKIEGVGTAPLLVARDADGRSLADRPCPVGAGPSDEDLVAPLMTFIDEQLENDRLAVIGHRIVHGGAAFQAPVLIDERVMSALERLCPLAPLHQPHNLAAVRAAQALRPHAAQVACFDTAFHHGHEDVVTRFAIPRTWHDQGVRRYGFHGLSFEFIARRLRDLDPVLASGRCIVAHLGSGASLCALVDGRSLDTTMGFTALDGLVMGTRCGAVDPGVLLYLEQEAGLTPTALSTLLYQQSGLLGVSGLSADMRVLLASDDARAREAVDLFVYRVAREAGALQASMGGLDGVVFTAGIGENAPQVREAIAARMAWTGLTLDPQANRRGAGRISTRASGITAWVIPTDEETVIAHYAAGLIGAAIQT
ncbi:MAG: acetate/propionate family kinase [Brevundimonas sp.]|jgi:acetate kinase|uniref:acetate/propionate family kinase n=1 Tax=Brevundimonas sp. TaxID=1871086 RepID=UPI0025BBFCA9|nr:acetate/propionate family kinase [Brevundimonas sp.]MCH4267287.1 acetate/propionate family kinase [Brevundimonas sp.]